MDVTIHFPFGTNDSGLWIPVIISLFVLWVLTLVSFLKRTDLKETDRLVWTIVLCLLNVVGMVLYWFMAPPSSSKEYQGRVRTEKELKEYFNRRGKAQ
ncbi:MAG: PLD nuclease N-terminal domain-containing protein [Chthoniobacteraceae bacterium]